MSSFLAPSLNLKGIKSTLLFCFLCSYISWSQSEEPNMYHNHAIDMMRENIDFLATTEEYADNTTFLELAKQLPKKLDRYNIKNYETTLKYIADKLKVSEATIKKYYSPFHFTKEMANMHHVATHALADIYFTAEKYKDAITFYDKAMFTHTPVGTSGTTINKDFLRMELDVSEAYFELKDYDMAVLHLLHNLMNQQSFGDHVTDTLKEYEAFIDATVFLPKLEAMVKTIQEGEGYNLKYVFNGKTMQFSPFIESPSSCRATILSSDFYKSLNKNTVSKKTASAPSPKVIKPIQKLASFKIDDQIFHHAKAVNDFIKAVLIIGNTDTFSKDKAYQATIVNLITHLENNTFNEAKNELEYIVNNAFSIKASIKNLEEKQQKEVENMRHFALHYKLDIIMVNKEYAMALGAIQYVKSVEGFAFVSENKKEIETDREDLLFTEAFAYNGFAISEFGLINMLGALINCDNYETEINTMMMDVANVLGKERVVKFLTQLKTKVVNNKDDEITLTSAPFNVKVPNIKGLSEDQITNKIQISAIWKVFME
ncbi:hypothetical protein [Algibacter sp. L4_22]|uniref:hypothetical protein n=1 Tax=Algibacter sp. L4_22 TaxID=2942477 RepID=UPI00201B87F0|nr:hypothetical protein [Algibacter sp. L4_22]MCL5127730.1 hypothetical protein [Algibacter sp. L4_22]